MRSASAGPWLGGTTTLWLCVLLAVLLLPCCCGEAKERGLNLRDQAADYGCERETSRLVRETVQSSILPLLEQRGLRLRGTDSPSAGAGLSSSSSSSLDDAGSLADSRFPCLLDVTGDLYARQDEHRDTVARNRWTCLLCGKTFRASAFLDLHMHRRHAQDLVVPPSGAPTCLADYCNATMCEAQLAHRELSRLLSVAEDDAGGVQCDRHNMRRRQTACEQLFRGCIVPADPREGMEGKAPGEMEERESAAVAHAVARICSRASCEYLEHVLERKAPVTAFGALYILTLLCVFLGVCFFYWFSCMASIEEWESLSAPGGSFVDDTRGGWHTHASRRSRTHLTDMLVAWLRTNQLVRVRSPPPMHAV